jgi:hypothetical protein
MTTDSNVTGREKIETHPVQTSRQYGQAQAVVPKIVSMRAYEVYCHVFAPQPAMVTGWCRGGFGASEIIAFLYAHSFPKEEWRARVDEAFRGMEHL